MSYSTHTVRRVFTTHEEEDVDGWKTKTFDQELELPELVRASAHRMTLYAHEVPSNTPHHMNIADIGKANEKVATSIFLPNGISSNILDMTPTQKWSGSLHRTETIDHGVILQGSVWLVSPIGKTRADEQKTEETIQRTLLNAGDVFILNGTMHGWEAGDEGVRLFAVSSDAKPIQLGEITLGNARVQI